MNVSETLLPGVLIIEPRLFADQRGFFKESYNELRYQQYGIEQPFVQDNFSRSSQGVVRGLHFQRHKPQGKLVSCTRGEVLDLVVDIDPRSATFGQHVAQKLSEDNHLQLWVPPGYAHGFCVLSERADFQYKCTDFYDPEDEGGILWCDPDLALPWPISAARLSPKDAALPTLKALLGGAG